MDGRGRFLDNIFIERLWRSLKYECVYLRAFSGGQDIDTGIERHVAGNEFTRQQGALETHERTGIRRPSRHRRAVMFGEIIVYRLDQQTVNRAPLLYPKIL